MGVENVKVEKILGLYTFFLLTSKSHDKKPPKCVEKKLFMLQNPCNIIAFLLCTHTKCASGVYKFF